MTRRRTALPKREPNGRHNRALDRIVNARSPTEIRRLRDAALAGLRAAEWGSELGRLLLQSKLTPTQYEAGRRFAILAKEYHAAVGAPGFPTTSLGQNARSSHEEGQGEALRRLEVIRHYDEANVALAPLERGSLAILRLVCERDATCGSGSLLLLQLTLDALAAHWHIPP